MTRLDMLNRPLNIGDRVIFPTKLSSSIKATRLCMGIISEFEPAGTVVVSTETINGQLKSVQKRAHHSWVCLRLPISGKDILYLVMKNFDISDEDSVRSKYGDLNHKIRAPINLQNPQQDVFDHMGRNIKPGMIVAYKIYKTRFGIGEVSYIDNKCGIIINSRIIRMGGMQRCDSQDHTVTAESVLVLPCEEDDIKSFMDKLITRKEYEDKIESEILY